MRRDQADHLIDMIAQSQPVSELDRAAWHIVLGGQTVEYASGQIVRLRTKQRFVNPCDLNSTPDDPEWGEAWAIVSANFGRLGPGGDYGHPDINSAVMAARQSLRDMPLERSQWVFKAAFVNAAGSRELVPSLPSGDAPALPEGSL